MKCPFCGAEHSARPYLNIICGCGSKYYIHTGEWWNRNTGSIVKSVASCSSCFWQNICCSVIRDECMRNESYSRYKPRFEMKD